MVQVLPAVVMVKLAPHGAIFYRPHDVSKRRIIPHMHILSVTIKSIFVTCFKTNCVIPDLLLYCIVSHYVITVQIAEMNNACGQWTEN